MPLQRDAPTRSPSETPPARINLLLAYLFIPVVLLMASMAFAHHSFPGAYDIRRPFVMEGVVSEFLFRNPHTFIFIEVRDPEGNVTSWAVDLPPAMALVRGGFTADTVQPGDALMVLCSPARDGENVCGIGQSGGVYRAADDWTYNRDPRRFEEAEN